MKNIDATISVPDAQNVTVTISMYGFGQNFLQTTGSYWPFTKDEVSSRSYTFVYARNAKLSKKPIASNSLGARQQGDQLLHFESRNVTNISRFPSRAFEYSGDESITYVRFAFNVSVKSVILSF